MLRYALLHVWAWLALGPQYVTSTFNPGATGGTITFVANSAMANALVTTGNSVTTAAINCTGATLAVIAYDQATNANTYTLSSSPSNTWNVSPPAAYQNTNGMGVQLAYAFNPTVNSSMTASVQSVGATTRADIALYCFAGTLTTSGVYDTSTGNAAAGSATTKAPGSITPAQSGELFVSVATANNIGRTFTVDSSFTGLVNGSTNWTGAAAYLITTTGSAVSPTWTVNTADQLATSQVAFKHP